MKPHGDIYPAHINYTRGVQRHVIKVVEAVEGHLVAEPRTEVTPRGKRVEA